MTTLTPIIVPHDSYLRRFWPGNLQYRHPVPNRVHKLCAAGRIKALCSEPDGRAQSYEHAGVFYFDVSGAVRAVYADWPKDGHRKLNQLLDAVGELWRWQQMATIDEIYIMLITFDI